MQSIAILFYLYLSLIQLKFGQIVVTVALLDR
jgi:hypothetical protein